MSTIQLELDPVALREATSQALLGLLTPEMKIKLVEQAIAKMLTPSTNAWDKGVVPIQKAFEDAVFLLVKGFAVEQVKADPTIHEKLNRLLLETCKKLLDLDVDKLADKMADAFAQSIRNSRY